MATQPESPTYDVGVYQLETTDPVQGGVGGLSNAPLLNLANRTTYLKQHLDNLESGATIPPTVAPKNSPALTGSPTAPTQPLGDNDTSIATTAFVQGVANGRLAKSVAGGANVTLTADEAANAFLDLSGALTANISVIVPATSGQWVVKNGTSGSFTLTVKTASGSGITVAQGKTAELWCDGTNVYLSTTDFTSPALTGTPTAPTATAGTNTTQIATTAFVQAAVGGRLAKSVAGGANVTLTAAEAGNAILEFTGALTANIAVIVPTAPTNSWIVKNSTSGAFTLTVKTASGTGVAVTQGTVAMVFTDGTNVYDAMTDFDSIALTGDPTAPTAAQFDNDTSIATTAFVKQHLSGVAGVVGVNATTTLTAAHVNRLIVADNLTGPITYTLPARSAVPEGNAISFFNNSIYNVTVQRAGTDMINGSTATITVRPYDTLTLVASVAGNVWLTAGGSANLGNGGVLGGSIGQNGYQLLPTGLIVQWGININTASATTTITFPIAFPNNNFNVVASGIQGTGNVQAYVTINSMSKTAFNCNCFRGSGGTAPVLDATAGGTYVYWLATGN